MLTVGVLRLGLSFRPIQKEEARWRAEAAPVSVLSRPRWVASLEK